MKKSLILVGMLSIGYANAQDYSGKVGINTDAPHATLDITAKTTEGQQTEGLLIPRVTYAKMEEMKANLTEKHHGMMVFMSDAIDLNTGEVKEKYYNTTYATPYYVYDATLNIFVPFSPTGLTAVRATTATTPSEIPAYELSFNANLKAQHNSPGNRGEGSINLNPFEYGGYASGYLSFSAQGGEASGNYASATQFGKASGEYAFATQHGQASGEYAFAIQDGKASGDYATAIQKGVATGYASFALGEATRVTGTHSVAIGYTGTAEGDFSIAISPYSFAYAKGEKSIAIGGSAIGVASFATTGATANGVYSVAIGHGAESYNQGEVALGYHNFSTDNKIVEEPLPSSYPKDDKQLFSIGNGDNYSLSSVPSNAIVVLRNAKTGIGLPTDTTTPANSKPTEMLDVNGNIRVRGNTDSVVEGGQCANVGTITFHNDNFYGCKSTGWVLLNN